MKYVLKKLLIVVPLFFAFFLLLQIAFLMYVTSPSDVSEYLAREWQKVARELFVAIAPCAMLAILVLMRKEKQKKKARIR